MICAGLIWMFFPDNIIPHVAQAVACIRKNEFYSDFGW